MNRAPQLVASGDIRAARFVKISGDNSGAEADANEVVVGIADVSTDLAPLSDVVSTPLHARSGGQITLRGEGEVCYVEAGSGGLTYGQRVKSDADGKGVAAATTGTTVQNIGAIALDSAAEGGFCRVQVRFESVRPALT